MIFASGRDEDALRSIKWLQGGKESEGGKEELQALRENFEKIESDKSKK